MADFTRSIEVDAALAARRHRRLDRPRPRARPGRAADRRRGRRARRRARGAARRGRGRDASPGTRRSRTSTSTSRRRSTARIGPVAGKLHTGRSRNDQVATDLRLWLRRTIDRLDAGLVGLERALVGLAERDGDAVLPGSTHIQPAQPVLLAHHLLAYVEMLERDRGRLADAAAGRTSRRSGAGALAGAGYPLDREATAARARLRRRHRQLARRRVATATSSVEFLAAAALAMVHLSRFAEELTWWSNPRFGFVRLRRRVLDRQLDDAEQEEPRSGRADPRPRGPR